MITNFNYVTFVRPKKHMFFPNYCKKFTSTLIQPGEPFLLYVNDKDIKLPYNIKRLNKVSSNHYEDYQNKFIGVYICTDNYPLMWIWFEFLGILDFIWYHIIRLTYFGFKALNQGKDYIHPCKKVPRNPLEIAMLFSLNQGKDYEQFD